MSLRVRGWTFGAGAGLVFLLVMLAVFAPPDGRQHAELAQFFGRFHPLVIHFPVALLLLVPIFELAGLFDNHSREVARFVLGLAAISAIVAANLGWLLAWSGGYEGALVTRHMWGGAAVAAASVICWGLRGWKGNAYAVAIVATLAILVWTSDQGGKLTHGETFLTERMPQPFRGWLGVQKKTSVDSNSFYATRIQPVFDQKCTGCHNAEKFKGKLRLDSYEAVMAGGKDGPVIHPGEPGRSELFRRITLSLDNKDFMPAEGKPALSEIEVKTIETWIAAGATVQVAGLIAPEPPQPIEKKLAEPLTEDYRPQAATIAKLESSLGIRLVPRSQNPTDGLILRTVSAPERCTDEKLAQLAPVANLIVDAELARTRVTDKGMQTLAAFSNLRFLDLTGTAVTSTGAKELAKLDKLESLNLTHTKVTRDGVPELQSKPALKKLYLFEDR